MKHLPTALLAATLLTGSLPAGPAPANSKLLLEDDFERAELGKEWHVNNGEWKIMKHIDKARRKEDPNETLAQAETAFDTGHWYTLRVTAWGPAVTATIEGKESLKASHPTFGVKKPTLVFRCIGDGVEVDDVKVWAQDQ